MPKYKKSKPEAIFLPYLTNLVDVEELPNSIVATLRWDLPQNLYRLGIRGGEMALVATALEYLDGPWRTRDLGDDIGVPGRTVRGWRRRLINRGFLRIHEGNIWDFTGLDRAVAALKKREGISFFGIEKGEQK